MALDPLLSPADAQRLHESLLAIDYTTDAVLERIGEEGQAGLHRNISLPADLALTGGTSTMDALAVAIRLWLLQRPAPRSAIEGALPVDALLGAGILQAENDQGEGDQLVAGIDIRPYGSPDDGASGWLVSDLTPGFDHRRVTIGPDYVLGASPASTTLAQVTMRQPIGRALDLGTGCGIQSLHLARHATKVVATDLNPRALQLARLTMQLNGLDVDLREGSLYEPVTSEAFDLIVTNPPYVMSPPSPERLVYREGSFEGDGLVRAVISGARDHLTPGGTLQVLGNWAILRDQPWQGRLDAWAAPDCDFWVIERERLSTFEYIEMWLTDAGLHQSPQWEQKYREWVDYFDRLGIIGVGMGWLTLTRSERDNPERRYEEWPWAVEQPVGPAIGRTQQDLTTARLPRPDLLASTFTLADHIVEESTGAPGAAGPEHIVIRQNSGLRRAIDAGTALAAVLGACDGDLTLGAIINAVSQLLEVDAEDLTPELEPRLREAIRDGFLNRIDS